MSHSEDDTFIALGRPGRVEMRKMLEEFTADYCNWWPPKHNEVLIRQFLEQHRWTLDELNQAKA